MPRERVRRAEPEQEKGSQAFVPVFLSASAVAKVYAEAGGAVLEANALEARLRRLFGSGDPLTEEGERILATAPLEYARFVADYEETLSVFLPREES